MSGPFERLVAHFACLLMVLVLTIPPEAKAEGKLG